MPSKNQTLRPILSTMPERRFLIMFILPTDSTKNQEKYLGTHIHQFPKIEQDSEISDLGMAALRAFRLEEAEKKANKEKNK